MDSPILSPHTPRTDKEEIRLPGQLQRLDLQRHNSHLTPFTSYASVAYSTSRCVALTEHVFTLLKCWEMTVWM